MTEYDKYLTAEPTPLMVHIEEWIRDKTGFDPKAAKTKQEAFEMGVFLTVALRTHHQASPENQERLAENRRAAEAVEAEKEERRAARASAREQKAREKEAVPPKKRGRPKKVVEEVEETAETEVEAPAPKRRGRPRKDAAPAAPAEAATPPVRRRRPAAAATEETPATEASVTPISSGTKRRRPVRRGEAAF